MDLTNKEKYIVSRYLLAVERFYRQEDAQTAISTVSSTTFDILKAKEEKTLKNIKALQKSMENQGDENNTEKNTEKACVAPKTMLAS